MAEILSSNNTVGVVIEGQNTQDTLQGLWQHVTNYGIKYQSQRGVVKSIKAITLIINNTLTNQYNFPYWNQAEDDWYQANFVRKESNHPPEILTPSADNLYPYRYSDRSRYYDGGLGYVKGVIDLLQALGVYKIDLKDPKELVSLIENTFMVYHPERVLAVLHWQGSRIINYFLQDPTLLDWQLLKARDDTLLSVIAEIKHDPKSRRAITPSFIYQNIDHTGVAGGVPVYQNYQLFTEGEGSDISLVSIHQHRAIDAFGGTQLDVSHDREWGLVASKELGLPLRKIIIEVNDAWVQVPNDSNIDLASKTDIRSWLFAVTDGYDPKKEDIERRLSLPTYRRKIYSTLGRLNNH